MKMPGHEDSDGGRPDQARDTLVSVVIATVTTGILALFLVDILGPQSRVVARELAAE
jgi:hypothetical protein